jgi:hypothetical protein
VNLLLSFCPHNVNIQHCRAAGNSRLNTHTICSSISSLIITTATSSTKLPYLRYTQSPDFSPCLVADSNLGDNLLRFLRWNLRKESHAKNTAPKSPPRAPPRSPPRRSPRPRRLCGAKPSGFYNERLLGKAVRTGRVYKQSKASPLKGKKKSVPAPKKTVFIKRCGGGATKPEFERCGGIGKRPAFVKHCGTTTFYGTEFESDSE